MELEEISSVEDLRKAGNIPDLVKQIKNTISPLTIEADTYDELFDVVIFLQKNFVSFIKGPFISRQAEFIYYLTELEGKQRNRAIGITDNHYEDKNIAKKWYKEVSQLVHPDKGGNATAFNVLRKLYEVMVDVKDDENE
ncbi:hypothetical protein [Aeromonas salmonicida]|uniref:hypothetical protein n=1 Tax=Aeromonas salmonicida TaxID=645 RepID=UPI00223FFAC3|nr:hypothetical protein [Aeromonas salmonicida]